MKILKRAKQKNVVLDTYHYTTHEIYNLLLRKVAFIFNDEYVYIPPTQLDLEEINLYKENVRIDLEFVDRLKVIYDPVQGCYRNAAVLKNGMILFICL